MIQIDRLKMHLPKGFEHRAITISRLIGERLAKKSMHQNVSLDSLTLQSQRVALNSTDEEIAAMVAEQIIAAVKGRQV